MQRSTQKIHCLMLKSLLASLRPALLVAHSGQRHTAVMTEGTGSAKTSRKNGQQKKTAELNLTPAILVYDRDTGFREALRNFLLAAGYAQVDVAASLKEALARLHQQCYSHVLIGLSRPFSLGQQLAKIAQRRQSSAKIFLLLAASDQPFFKNALFKTVIKEYVYWNLMESM